MKSEKKTNKVIETVDIQVIEINGKLRSPANNFKSTIFGGNQNHPAIHYARITIAFCFNFLL